MKKRILAFLLSITVVASTIGGMNLVVFAEPSTQDNSEENSQSDNTDNREIKYQKDGEITAEDLATNAELTTGTQQNAIDNEVDVDEDIEKEVISLIPEQIETIHIANADDLIKLSKNCRLDTWSANKSVVLDNDILLSDTDFVTIPIFAGTFDGQNHTISGYLMESEQSNIGLFATLSKGALVQNLNLVGNVIPEGKSSVVGAFCGHNNGTIRNCKFKGVVKGTDYIGGFVGINELHGIISDCSNDGFIEGTHFTGGIAGENMGNILRCTNTALVNTKTQEVTTSVEDISISKYVGLFNFGGKQTDTEEKTTMVDGVVDTGGIAGVSIGVIQHCTNDGNVGYERFGYNVGGIAGRQSGYLTGCLNNGKILGRKDVGGIVGQAEPYVTIDFSQDIVRQLTDNISKLHDTIAVTLQDVDGQSDVISNRLSVIQQFTNSALDDTSYLADSTVTWVDGVVGEGNKAASRVDYVLEQLSKDGGALSEASAAASNLGKAAQIGEELFNTLEDFDIESFINQDEKAQFKGDLSKAKDAATEYEDMMEDATDAFTNYQRDRLLQNPTKDYHLHESDLKPVIGGNVKTDWSYSVMTDSDEIYEKYKDIEKWVHYNSATGESTPYPAESNPQKEYDDKLEADVASQVTAIGTAAEAYATAKFSAKYGEGPTNYFSTQLIDAARLAYNMGSDTYDGVSDTAQDIGDDGEEMMSYIKKLSDNLRSCIEQTRGTMSEVAGMEDINLPKLGDEYRAHTASLNSNLRNMSDNFGYLNGEMNGATDTLVADLSNVNDQFNVIMNLYTDAIDGVLDNDYSDVIEDDSRLVAQTCVDATVENCTNYGCVEGSIDTAGIVGTMAIEYDYDLESDVTGIKQANTNTTYLTKCVLRSNNNRGNASGQKDYVGGVCGRQEMGTIIWCGNYSKVESTGGDYVGGVAGLSISNIIESYSKGIIGGRQYIGGIVGEGMDLTGCLAIPNISEADSIYGAIAGHIDSNGVVRDNYFVGDDLAGIDRVSYSKKAEPVLYTELLHMEGIPDDFRKMTVTYVLEDEDSEETETVVTTKDYGYGDYVSYDDFPSVPDKDGYYVEWSIKELEKVIRDEETTATYVRYYTTLASEELLANGQSCVLVDGHFKEGDHLAAAKVVAAADKKSDAIEYWELSIPADGAASHQIRYHVGDEFSEEIGDDFDVYVCVNDTWMLTEPQKMGSYRVFEVGGQTPKFQVVNTHKYIDVKKYAIIGGCSAGAVILILAVVIITSRKRRGSRRLKTYD